MPRPPLSKSRYISGRQCPLRLWNDCFNREAAEEVTEAQQAVFDTGQAVGELATLRHPGGVLVEATHFESARAERQTRALLKDPDVPAIFEAGFSYERVRVRVDILARATRGRWVLTEVKSTASVKETHLEDLAVQYWVARGAGIRIAQAGVLTLNRNYVYRGGDYDVDALFVFHDCTKEVRALQRKIAPRVADMHRMLRRKRAPAIEPGAHCNEPYRCPYLGDCTHGLEQVPNPVTHLPRLSARKCEVLEAEGIVTMEVLHRRLSEQRAKEAATRKREGRTAKSAKDTGPVTLTTLQKRALRCVVEETDHVGKRLLGALREPRYPIHHLDFEAVAPTLPLYPGTRPFEAVPFQWSNHIEHDDGRIVHDAYLCDTHEDPREALTHALLRSLGTRGSIVTYSSYERRVIRELARALPAYAARLKRLEKRLWDLLPVLREHYYHPAFRGSFSIKAVLPALVPTMTYQGMAVADGMAAGRAFQQMLGESRANARRRIRRSLLAYCKQDTLAMVTLRRVLYERAAGNCPTHTNWFSLEDLMRRIDDTSGET